MQVPSEFLYTPEHEWTLSDEDVITVGVTDYAQSELGDIAYVNLPAVGDEVKANEKFGEIEAVKTVSDLFAPVSGEIIEVNTQLETSPELVNTDPYGQGWLIKIKLTDSKELEDLLSPDNYTALISE